MKKNIRRYRRGISDVEKFWECVDRSNSDGCWLWKGSLANGYGQFTIYGTKHQATRYLIFMRTGEYPEGLVLHKCDNPICVNPDHLYIGTERDNAIDRQRTFLHSLYESDLK